MHDRDSRDLDVFFDFVKWRTSMNLKMLELDKRISLLEAKKHGEIKSNIQSDDETIKSVDSFAVADWNKIGCVQTFLTILKSKRHAQMQFFLFLILVIVFLYYGVDSLMDAKINEESDYKPEWKSHVVDYVKSGEKYEMPSIFLRWCIRAVNFTDNSSSNGLTESSSRSDLEDFLVRELALSQNNFHNSVKLEFLTNSKTQFVDVNVSTGFETRGSSSDLSFWGHFKLDISAPEPEYGPWRLSVVLDVGALSINDAFSLETLIFTVLRDDYDSNSQVTMLNLYTRKKKDTVDVFLFDYSEAVTHKKDGSVATSFEVSSSQTRVSIDQLLLAHRLEVESSDIVLYVVPDLEVEHWFEYIAFGYKDWVSGMGGLFSIMTFVFFWTSYYIAVYFGDGETMGILPIMSFNFYNFEDVHWIKRRLREDASD